MAYVESSYGLTKTDNADRLQIGVKLTMQITFGIITNGNNNLFIKKIHQSIVSQNIDDKFEIIIVGGSDPQLEYTTHIPFDESIKEGWISKKKNIIANVANYDNIVLMHDYIYLDDLWYHHFKNFSDDWDVCMNSVINHDGQRHRDWITWPEWCPEKDMIFLDYEDHSKTEEMYVSGSYFCVKKDFLLSYPINEELCWGKGEDVEWSSRIRHVWNYKCNPDCKVLLLKDKYNGHWAKPCNLRARQRWMSMYYQSAKISQGYNHD